jgi:hypothetical protein
MLQNQKKITSMIAVVIAGEAIFLLPFILMRVFKPIIRDFFLISDTQIDEAQALYAITAMLCYIFGRALLLIHGNPKNYYHFLYF